MPKRKLLAAVISTICSVASVEASIYINEIHYDNTGTDVGEFVELVGPTGTNLSGWKLVFYNGSPTQLSPYASVDLTETLADDTGTGYGFSTVFQSGIQNGAPDGIALVDNLNNVIQFISYEGSFTANSGEAAGLTSEDIGAAETSDTAVGESLQLTGSGILYTDFTWEANLTQTPGALNIGQSINGSDFGGGTEPVMVPIYEIQGALHASPYEGESVITSGVVVATDTTGVYVQDPLGDGDDNTSDAIFLYTGTDHGLLVGDSLTIEGVVTEYTPGGDATGNLSLTEFYQPTITVEAANQTLPVPVVIGAGGRLPPVQIIDDDQLSLFDPESDGIDFYESLESMRVTLEDAVAVSPTNRYGEIFALSNRAAHATGMNPRGGITVQPDDFNPERVQIDFDDGIHPLYEVVDTGDLLGDVTGVIGYSYGNFEIYPTESFTPQSAQLQPEISTLNNTRNNQLTIASYNLLNLDPNDADGDTDLADGRFDRIAEQIVNQLHSPQILALQEIQDNSGSVDDGEVSADLTLTTLINAIQLAGGPGYHYIDNPPVDNQDGGQPGANIRVAYLYDPEYVQAAEVLKIEDQDLTDGDAFLDSRKPLYTRFTLPGRSLHLINAHLSSKGGSTPLFGQVQPPVNGSEDERIAQALEVNRFAADLIANDPQADIVVLGDLNEFQFMPALNELKGSATPILVNLTDTLSAEARYSYNYQGNAQALDHILVTHALAQTARYDLVHLNSEFADYASDHDPAVLQLDLGDSLKSVRVATFNASLNRSNAGDLITDLSTPNDPQAKAVAEIIQRTRPDILLLNEFDYDAEGQAIRLFINNYLRVPQQNGIQSLAYNHVYIAPVNTGVPSGFDLDNDGYTDGPGDAYGFGYFPGQYGMVLLTRYPIERNAVRSFQNFLWQDMPDALLPTDWYDVDEQAVLRLSSKSHWDIPVSIRNQTVHFLASHPTPPVFDGTEDRNGRRNHDEIRFWIDYINGADYIYDDSGRYGGLGASDRFVIVGDLNADPFDGDSRDKPAAKLLADPRINTEMTPVSIGAAEAAIRQGEINLEQTGAADFDTADFTDSSPGNLRVDYVLPSSNIEIRGAGVFWPAASDPDFDLVGDWPFPSSDHRLIWVDLGKRTGD